MSSNDATFGSGLKGIYNRETLITGKPVNDQNLNEFIAIALPSLMPGFRHTLNQEDAKALIGCLPYAGCKMT